MKPLEARLLFSVLAVRTCAAASSEATPPRGVGPDLARFYKNPTEFACISNPLRTIPASQVNDDYCDCSDGSDEPGTSACSSISPLSPQYPPLDPSASNITLALPGFYCGNNGHIPSHLPFLSVNDGKCDYTLCCDGSDEWQHVGGITCPSRCKEIGKEWRVKDAERKKSLATARKNKKELLAKAANLRQSAQQRIEELGMKLEDAEKRAAQTARTLQEAETSEKSKVVRSPDGKTGRVAMLAGLAKSRVEELRSNLIEVREQRNTLDSQLEELEAALSSLKQDYNPNFNDEAVKRTVRAWEEYAARDKQGGSWEAAKDRDLDEISKPDDENNGINWISWENEDDPAPGAVEAVLFGLSAYAPVSLRLWLGEKLLSFRQVLVESGILADPSEPTSPGTESATLTKARSDHKTAEKAVSTAQNDISTAKGDLTKPDFYGAHDIFRALKDKCITRDSGEYTYEICLLGTAKQKSRKGAGDTNLGRFSGLTSEYVDDDDVDGRGLGLGTGRRIVMKYENGQQCWNGPARSAMVVLGCSPTEEIWRVAEREKCVYRIEVGTAAVCDDGDADGGGGGGKKEKKKKEKDEL